MAPEQEAQYNDPKYLEQLELEAQLDAAQTAYERGLEVG